MNFVCLQDPVMLASPNDCSRKFKQKAVFFALLFLFSFFGNFSGKRQEMFVQGCILASANADWKDGGMGLHWSPLLKVKDPER